MNILGLDVGGMYNPAILTKFKIKGSYKAPSPHDVTYHFIGLEKLEVRLDGSIPEGKIDWRTP